MEYESAGGLGAYGAPDTLEKAIADRFDEEGHPKGIVAVSTLCTGKNNDEPFGMNRLSQDGLKGAREGAGSSAAGYSEGDSQARRSGAAPGHHYQSRHRYPILRRQRSQAKL